jgi:hypothetical protein
MRETRRLRTASDGVTPHGYGVSDRFVFPFTVLKNANAIVRIGKPHFLGDNTRLSRPEVWHLGPAEGRSYTAPHRK